MLRAAVIALCLASSGAWAASTNNLSAEVDTNISAIAPADIATRAESAEAYLRSVENGLAADRLAGTVETNLAVLTPELNSRLEENSKLLQTSQSIPTLRRLASEWEDLHEELSGWQHNLSRRVTQLDQQRDHLQHLSARWRATHDAAAKEQIPPELVKRVDQVTDDANAVLQRIGAERTRLLSLLSQLGELDGRVGQLTAAIERAREERLNQLLVRDSSPIWMAGGASVDTNAPASRFSLALQWKTLRSYVERKRERFALHGAIILGLVSLLLWGRRSRWAALAGSGAGSAPTEAAGSASAPTVASEKVSDQAQRQDYYSRSTFYFDAPGATALLLSLLLSGWLYPQAPRLLDAIIGAAALVPAVIILRHLVDRRLFVVLDVLVALYFVDQLRLIAAAEPALSRLLFLTEMVAAAGFAMWLVRAARSLAKGTGQRLWRNILLGARLGLMLFTTAALADAAGYVGLGKFIGHATLSCAYLALVLYAAVQIIDALVRVGLGLRPCSALGMIQRHRSLLETSGRRLLVWVAGVVWVLYALEAVSLREPFFEDLKGLLTTRRNLGAVRFELWDVLLFVLTIWAALLVSRFSRFVLQEEVYPRMQLPPGLHYSVSTILHYIILLVGCVIALGLLGFNLQNLTILAGAFSVGLGFGLQNIVNNFVSGIILLFERPIKVGDVVQMEGVEGIVQRIGIRASIVRTPSGSEIIVPNGNLLSNPVTNWTLSDRRRRVELPVSVPAPANAQALSQLLVKVAGAHPLILKQPPPQVLLTNPDGAAVNLELRAWTDHAEDYARIRSDLALSVREAIAREKTPAT